ncbi:hypothetical protein LFM09_40100 [Lentzea alba]|uniref:hypothetical protein n=1 Tax=Lentzea alba TaxID=2714351 RepID=UPI0039BF0C4B
MGAAATVFAEFVPRLWPEEEGKAAASSAVQTSPPASPDAPERTTVLAPTATPSKPAPKKPAAQGLPDGYAGRWNGQGQKGDDSWHTVTVEVQLTAGDLLTDVGSVRMVHVGGSYDCEGRLRLEGVAADLVTLSTGWGGTCTGYATIGLQVDGDIMEYGDRPLTSPSPQWDVTARLRRA